MHWTSLLLSAQNPEQATPSSVFTASKEKVGIFPFTRFRICCSDATKPAACILQYKLARAIILSFVTKALSRNREYIYHLTTSEAGLTARPNIGNLLQLATKNLQIVSQIIVTFHKGTEICYCAIPLRAFCLTNKKQNSLLQYHHQFLLTSVSTLGSSAEN